MKPEAEQTVEAAIERLRELARAATEKIEAELKRLRAALEKANDPTWPRQ